MEFFSRPIADLRTEDLQGLLDDEAQENVRLEFKREVPTRNELLKKLSAMANTYGGYLIMGAEEDGNGKLRALPGVEEQQSLKQTVVQWGQGGVYPPLVPEVAGPIPAPEDPSRELYVLYVPESLEAPHFLEGRRGAYVRTDEFSERFEARLAKYEEIAHLANRRELAIRRRTGLFSRAEARYGNLIEQDYEEAQGTSGPPGTQLYLAVAPSFPVTPLVDQGAIADFLRNERLLWRQVGFPRGREMVTQHESVLDLHVAFGFSLLEATTWGQVFYASEVERLEEEQNFIHLYSFLGHIQVYLAHAAKFFAYCAFDGLLNVRVKMTGLRGVRFRYERMPEYRQVLSRFDDELDMALDVPAADLVRDSEEVAKKLYRMLFFAVNWPEATADDPSLQRLVDMGYEYNNLGPRRE